MEGNTIFVILDNKHSCICLRGRHYLYRQRLFVNILKTTVWTKGQSVSLLTRRAEARESLGEFSPDIGL